MRVREGTIDLNLDGMRILLYMKLKIRLNKLV